MKKIIFNRNYPFLFVLLLVMFANSEVVFAQLFRQDFNGTAAVYIGNGTRVVPAGDYVDASTPGTSKWNYVATNSKQHSGIAFNTSSSASTVPGALGMMAAGGTDNVAGYIFCRTTPISSSSPTALKITFNMKCEVTSGSSSAPGKFFFQVGNSFSTSGTGTTSGQASWNSGINNIIQGKEPDNNVFAGFSLAYISTSVGATLLKNDGVLTTPLKTAIGTAFNTWTIIINKSGGSLNYTDPTTGTSSVANNAMDIWIGSTLAGDEVAAITTTATLDNFKFGEFGITGKGRTTWDWIQIDEIIYFRSKASGNWSEASTWESSYDNSTWADASVAPGSSTSGIQIQNGHQVTVNANATTSEITVNPGAQLTINPGITLSTSALVNNGVVNLGSDASGTATILHATISGSGICNVSQYLPDARNWYVSSPVSSAKANSGYTFYSWDESLLTGTNGWVTMTTGNGITTGDVLSPGKGYIALPGAAASTLTFTGTLNSGDVNVAISNSGAGSTTGFNLIGNPYPCHLTWTKTFVDNNTATILPTIWYRTNAGTANNSGQWSYKTYNASTGEASPAGTTGIIPPMQAFWVKAAAAGTLTLNSDLTKSHQSSNPLKAPAVKNTDRKRLRLQVSNGTSTDETLMFFDEAASNGFDLFDSPKMFVNSASMAEIYTQTGSEKLVINGMSVLTDDKTIPLGFVAQQAGNFSISAIEIGNFDRSVKIVLKDSHAGGAEFDLTGGAVYNFSSVATSASTDRFSVVLRSSSTTTGVNTTKMEAQVYVDATNQVVLNAPVNSEYSVYNCNGQVVLRGVTKLDITTLMNFRPAAGVYVVKIQNKGKLHTSNIVIK